MLITIYSCDGDPEYSRMMPLRVPVASNFSLTETLLDGYSEEPLSGPSHSDSSVNSFIDHLLAK